MFLASAADSFLQTLPRIPCILWQAEAEGLPGWDQDLDGRNHLFRWEARILDESAAQRVLPLPVPAGSTYYDAWNASRHPDDIDALSASTAEALIMRLPAYSREYRCVDPSGQTHWLHEEIAVEPHGRNRWRLFGVVTNITPRKLVELALRESEQRFRAMADGAPVMIWVSGTDKLCTWFNKPWRDFTGRSMEQEVGNGWAEGVHPDDLERCIQIYSAAFDAREPFEMEYRLRRRDGQYRWVLDHGVPRFSSPDAPLPPSAVPYPKSPASFSGYIGSCIDITDRKRAELELSTVTNRVPCILWRADVQGLPGWREDADGQQGLFRWDLHIINEQAAQRLLPIDVPLGKRYRDAFWGKHIHPDDCSYLRRTTAHALRAGQSSYDREYRVIDRHGRLHWFHEDVFIEPRGVGSWELFGVVTDVTSRKLSQLALRESESRYALATAHGGVGIWEWNVTADTLHLSDSLKAIFGYAPHELAGIDRLTWRTHLHPDDLPVVLSAVDSIMDGRAPGYELEVRRRHKDGSYRWITSRASVTRDPVTGRPLRMTGVVTDITDRKRTEDALRTSESRYALATAVGGVGIWEYDVDADALHLSPNLPAMLGYTPEEIPDMRAWRSLIHPDDLPTILAANDDPTCVQFEAEVRRRHKDGSWRWLISRGTKTRDPATGRLLRITGIHTDITDRKRAEDSLRQSQRRYTLATQAGAVGIWDYDYIADVFYLSPNLRDMLGYAPDELTTLSAWQEILHPDDRAVVQAHNVHCHDTTFELEVRRRCKEGDYRWFLSRGVISYDPATGQRTRMTGSLTDITDRKRADDALRASEAHFRTLLEQSPIATFIFSPDGQYLRSNQAAADLYGFGHDEMVDYNVFTDPTLAGTGIIEAYQNALDGHPTPLPEVPITPNRGRFNGRSIWIRGSVYPLRDPASGQVQALVALNEDITDRKLAEDALRASERNYRAAADSNKRLLLELDHRIRNNLAGLQSLTSLMRDRAPTVADFASAIDARLRAMSHVHHLLSESRWQDLDLRSLLSSFLSHTRHLTPHPTPLHLDGPAVPLPASCALPLTMILSEFLTNSAKYGAHSSPAGQVSLTWTLIQPQNEDGGWRMEDSQKASSPSSILHPPSSPLLCLRWTETGGPVPASNPVPSLGTALIHSFSTRELAGGCTLTYPPSGASHILTFPLLSPKPQI